MTEFSFFESKSTFRLLIFALLWMVASETCGQRPRFADFFSSQSGAPAQQVVVAPGQVVQGPIVGTAPLVGTPQLVSPGIQTAPPPGTLIAPAFDPFQPNVQPLPFGTTGLPQPTGQGLPTLGADTVPSLGPPTTRNIEVLPPISQTQPAPFPGFQGGLGSPSFQQPGSQPVFPQAAPQSVFGAPNFGQPAPAPQGPVFPRAAQTGQFFRRFRDEFLPRLFERPRFRHTYIAGNNGNELQMHDTEFATTLTIPRFLFVEQPVRITPGFISHFWDGPVTAGPFGTGFDLPETAFSAFLTLEHLTNPNMQGGLETNFTVGVYSDYEHLSSDSFRLTGVVLGWARINPTNVFKFGVEYFDRVEVKLLPAFGLFVRPTPDLELDLYFPRPRIAQRYPNFRNLEVWGYLAGEFGGGSWTVERIGFDDQVDINDFRATFGLEWVGARNVNGFIETGYVFNRELVSKLSIPSRELELQDSVMLRMGLSF